MSGRILFALVLALMPLSGATAQPPVRRTGPAMRPVSPEPLLPPPAPPAQIAPLLAPPPESFYLDSAQPKLVRNYSRTYIEPPGPRRLYVHDIVTIVVNEASEVILNSRYDRQRNGTLAAELKEFVRISDGSLVNAAEDSPTVDTALIGRLQNGGQAADQEAIRYRIAATVVDVKPNGTLVLEARKSIKTTDALWEYTLTGKIRSEDILRDNTALSENIADLQIVKVQEGKVYDSAKRPWGLQMFDWLSPF